VTGVWSAFAERIAGVGLITGDPARPGRRDEDDQRDGLQVLNVDSRVVVLTAAG
jgi:hypothetical protein